MSGSLVCGYVLVRHGHGHGSWEVDMPRGVFHRLAAAWDMMWGLRGSDWRWGCASECVCVCV